MLSWFQGLLKIKDTKELPTPPSRCLFGLYHQRGESRLRPHLGGKAGEAGSRTGPAFHARRGQWLSAALSGRGPR